MLRKGFTEEDLSDSGKWLYAMLWERGDSAFVRGDLMEREGNGEASNAGEKMSSGGIANDGKSMSEGLGGTVEVPADNGESYGEASGREQKSGDLEVTASIVNSWEQEGKSYYQYTLTITNPTEEDIKGWTISLEFSGDIALQDAWNGSYQAERNILTISSLEYNGDISKGSSVENIGFIVQGEAGLTLIR